MVIDDIYINYIDYGNNEKDTIVLLHGWGQNIEMMNGIGNCFKKNNRIVVIDLPGHGKSEEPKEAYTVLDYVLCIHKLLQKINVVNPIIIGHSFGGKIGLLYSSKYEVKKLVCLASPFKKNIKKDSLKTKALKTAKKIPLLNKLEVFAKKHIGSSDYRNSSDMMRKIMVLTVNYDITEEVKKIKCPTLLIWGTNDEAVNYNDALELESLIKDCGLVTYEGCTHYAYLERFNQTIEVLRSFLGDE